MTDRPQLLMLPIQRPNNIQFMQAQQPAQGQGQTRLQRTISDPNTLTRLVQGLGRLVDRGTQPAQDLGAWATGPISQRLMNPFGNGQGRAQMPGQRARTLGR